MGLFGADIVGQTVAVHYPEPVPSLFHVRVVSFSARTGWHGVRSVPQSGAGSGTTWDFLGGRWEEEFVDVLDVNLYWTQGLVYFLGERELNQTQCGICRQAAVPRTQCGVTCARCRQQFHERCVVEKKKPLSPGGLCFQCRSDYAAHVPVVADLASVRVKAAVQKVASEIYQLQSEIQLQPRTRVHIVEGTQYLRELCSGQVGVAVQALQSCSVAGVLQWHGQGGVGGEEAENTRILRRALDPQDTNTILLVAVPEVCISSRGKGTLLGGVSAPKQSLSFTVHNTLGFVVVGCSSTRTAGLGASSPEQAGEDTIGQILLFSARSTHARSVDELLSVVREGGSSVVCFSLWDTKLKLPVHSSQISDLLADSLVSTPVFPRLPAALPVSQHKQQQQEQQQQSAVTRTVTRSVTIAGEEFHARDATRPFPTRRFLLTTKLQTVPFMCPAHVEAPSRLLLGAAMRLLQELGRRAVLLELALPVNGPVLTPGHGREVHRLLLQQQQQQPQQQAAQLAPSASANVAAYKVYRAFGFGESAALLHRGLNAQPDFLYPVMISACSLISKDTLRKIILRKSPGLKGIAGWANRCKQPLSRQQHGSNSSSGSGGGILTEVSKAETLKQTLKDRLLLLPCLQQTNKKKTKNMQQSAAAAPEVAATTATGSDCHSAFVEELALFEYMVDEISSSHTTCAAPPGLAPQLQTQLRPWKTPSAAKKRQRQRQRADSHDSFKSLPSSGSSNGSSRGSASERDFSSLASGSPATAPRRKLPRRACTAATAAARQSRRR